MPLNILYITMVHSVVTLVGKKAVFTEIDVITNNSADFREGHGAMVRAWRSVDVAGFSEKYHACFFLLNLGTLLRWCVLGQDTSPSNASLDLCENEYLLGHRWQCAR